MIRVIVRTDYASMAVNVAGAAVVTEFKTFDISAPELEAFVAEPMHAYNHRSIVGVETNRSG